MEFDWSRLANPLQDIGYGLTQGSNLQESLAAAGQRTADMAQPRAQAVMLAKEEERRQAAIQQTAQALRNMGPDFEQLAVGVEAGGVDPSQAMTSAFSLAQRRKDESAALSRARANAQFLSDPNLRGMVESGAMDFADAYKYQLEGGAGPKPTDDMREYQAAVAQGYQGTLMDFMRETKSGTTVNVGPTETSYDKEIGTALAKTDIDLQKGARDGTKAINTLTLMERQIADPGFYSGFGAQQILTLRRAAEAMGIDPGAIQSTEAFNSLSKQAALDVMGGSLGTGFSNADRDFVMDQVPNLQNTPEGNKAIIEIQKAIAQRKVEIAKFAQEYKQRNGGRLDGNFEIALAQWAEENPVFAGIGPSGGGDIDSLVRKYGF